MLSEIILKKDFIKDEKMETILEGISYIHFKIHRWNVELMTIFGRERFLTILISSFKLAMELLQTFSGGLMIYLNYNYPGIDMKLQIVTISHFIFDLMDIYCHLSITENCTSKVRRYII